MNDFLSAEIAADAAEIPADVLLTQVADLAERLSQLDTEIERMELEVKGKKDSYNELANKKLPEAMGAVGLKKFELTDGTMITVKPYYTAKIDDDNRVAAHGWLENHGFADLIKHQFNVSLGKGEAEMAAAVKNALESVGASYTDKEAVHWQTLVAWIKEQVEGGKEIDLDVFRAQIGQVAKIKRPKA